MIITQVSYCKYNFVEAHRILAIFLPTKLDGTYHFIFMFHDYLLYLYFSLTSCYINFQRKSEVEISGGSYFALSFFFLIAYLFLNHQKVSKAIIFVITYICPCQNK